MSIPNDQILDALLIYYRNRGVDLVHVLRDPIFSKMDINSKVAFIKRRGDLILQGSSPTMSPSEKSEVTSSALLAGISGGGLAAGSVYGLARNAGISGLKGIPQAAAAAVIGGGVVAASLGALSGYFKAKELKERRTAVRSQLLSAMRNPTLPNQVGVLSAGSIYDMDSGIMREVGQRVREITDRHLLEKSHITGLNVFDNTMSHYNPR